MLQKADGKDLKTTLYDLQFLDALRPDIGGKWRAKK